MAKAEERLVVAGSKGGRERQAGGAADRVGVAGYL